MTDASPTPDASPNPDAAAPAPRRKYPIVAIVLLALGAAALWGSSRLTWVTVTSADGLTEARTDHLNGGVWFGALTPLALVLLASIAAVLATRGWLRRMCGVLIGLLAAVTAVPAFALLTKSSATAARAATLAELPGRATVAEVVTAPFPAVLSLAGALAAFTAAVLLARMPEDSARLSGKYDNPVFRRAAATEEVTQRRTEEAVAGANSSSAQLSERVLWDALDAGTDPTEEVGQPDRAAAHSAEDDQGKHAP
ncbi:TIGR02234 family membrane protein [Nocardia australiensis]|uniref:TIGR02234 family membrane protein n=1 Tax=Nocardia australiensis TaxID=2887191 RepID=UPI001D1481DE|nr:TIGR02234 family membrane protein [Nocardia australiensis]